jgi:excinuclease UvrABC ATPase subunit
MIGMTETHTRTLPGTHQEILILENESFTTGSPAGRFTVNVPGGCWTCPHCGGQGCAVESFSGRKMPPAERCRFRCQECGGTWDMEGE